MASLDGSSKESKRDADRNKQRGSSERVWSNDITTKSSTYILGGSNELKHDAKEKDSKKQQTVQATSNEIYRA